ncbi:MAG: hypothetical protein WD078_05010 [Woeseia sp.]
MALAQRDVPGATPVPDDSLLRLVVALKATRYSFITATLATHARVNSRSTNAWARTTTDVFGWSRPFRESVLTPQLFEAIRNAEVLDPHGEGWLSRVRASTLRGQVFHYQELYPDVFGEELAEPAYADADRIAAVLLTARNATA